MPALAGTSNDTFSQALSKGEDAGEGKYWQYEAEGDEGDEEEEEWEEAIAAGEESASGLFSSFRTRTDSAAAATASAAFAAACELLVRVRSRTKSRVYA